MAKYGTFKYGSGTKYGTGPSVIHRTIQAKGRSGTEGIQALNSKSFLRPSCYNPSPYLGLLASFIALPCPRDSRRENVINKGEFRTIGGKTRWDIMGRKYRYILHWDFMSVEDYDIIETLVNSFSELTFIWNRYPSAQGDGVHVWATIPTRNPATPGNQTTGFYSEVNLELLEVESRI